MRCYICDYSPTCDSLFREGLQKTNYTQLFDSTFSAPDYNRLIDLPDGTSICDQCDRMSRDEDNKSFDLQFTADNDNETLPKEVEEIEEVA
jgi:hypothetical protein